MGRQHASCWSQLVVKPQQAALAEGLVHLCHSNPCAPLPGSASLDPLLAPKFGPLHWTVFWVQSFHLQPPAHSIDGQWEHLLFSSAVCFLSKVNLFGWILHGHIPDQTTAIYVICPVGPLTPTEAEVCYLYMQSKTDLYHLDTRNSHANTPELSNSGEVPTQAD